MRAITFVMFMALCSAAFSKPKEFADLNTLNDNHIGNGNRNEAGKVDDVNEETWNNNAEQDSGDEQDDENDDVEKDADQDNENDEAEQEADQDNKNDAAEKKADQESEPDEAEQDADQESETDDEDKIETGEDEDMNTSNDPRSWWSRRRIMSYYNKRCKSFC